MRISLRVDVDGMYFRGGAIREIPDIYRECFEPLKTCDDPIVSYVTGDAYDKTDAVMRVMKTREDAADILAMELALMIVNEMKKNDTHNGYA